MPTQRNGNNRLRGIMAMLLGGAGIFVLGLIVNTAVIGSKIKSQVDYNCIEIKQLDENYNSIDIRLQDIYIKVVRIEERVVTTLD